LTIPDAADCGLDQVPAALVLERSLDGTSDEGRATARAGASVELRDEIVTNRNV
jgi:hypothetical protein